MILALLRRLLKGTPLQFTDTLNLTLSQRWLDEQAISSNKG
jgi:hypothetical protein